MSSFADGTHRSPVRTHCAAPSGAARQCSGAGPASAQRHPACGRTRPRTARAAQPVRQLARHPHADESLAGERRPGPGLRTAATRADRADRARGAADGRRRCRGAPRRSGGAKENGPRPAGRPRGGRAARIHVAAADARTAVALPPSPGQARGAPEGRKPLNRPGRWGDDLPPAVDRAREGSETRQLALALGHAPAPPPLRARTEPWERNRETCRRRDETGRLLRRLKGFRRIFTRLGKPGVALLGFILFAPVVDAVRWCEHALAGPSRRRRTTRAGRRRGPARADLPESSRSWTRPRGGFHGTPVLIGSSSPLAGPSRPAVRAALACPASARAGGS